MIVFLYIKYHLFLLIFQIKLYIFFILLASIPFMIILFNCFTLNTYFYYRLVK